MPPKKIIFNTGARKFRFFLFFWRRESESASLQLLGWSGNTGDRPSRKNNSAVETLCEWSSWCGHKRSIGRTLMQKNLYRTHLYLFGLNPFGFVGIVGHVTGPTELLWRRDKLEAHHTRLSDERTKWTAISLGGAYPWLNSLNETVEDEGSKRAFFVARLYLSNPTSILLPSVPKQWQSEILWYAPAFF